MFILFEKQHGLCADHRTKKKSVGYWFTIHKDMFLHEFCPRINILCSEDLYPGRIGPYDSAPEVQKEDYFLYGCELYNFFIMQTFHYAIRFLHE